MNRSVALVIAMIMKQENKRFWEAYETVRTRRNQALPNIGGEIPRVMQGVRP